KYLRGGTMVRNDGCCIRDQQCGISVKVLRRDNFMIDMIGIAYQKMSTPLIGSMAKLAGTGHGLQLKLIRLKPYPTAPGSTGQHRTLAILVRHFASQIAKHFGVHLAGSGRFIGQVDPIVYAKKRAIEIMLGIGNGKTSQKGIAYIGWPSPSRSSKYRRFGGSVTRIPFFQRITPVGNWRLSAKATAWSIIPSPSVSLSNFTFPEPLLSKG